MYVSLVDSVQLTWLNAWLLLNLEEILNFIVLFGLTEETGPDNIITMQAMKVNCHH